MRILLVVADFYTEIAEMLLEGAVAHIEAHQHHYDVIRVPGALEIPIAIAMASSSHTYDGYVALGCVIRGETTHYDYVCGESARGLMELGVREHLAIGNGILTVESREQAIERAHPSRKNKGAGAVQACLALAEIAATYRKKVA